MNFFKSKPRTPPDLVRGLKDALPRLEAGQPGSEVRRKVCIVVFQTAVYPLSLAWSAGRRGGREEPPADQGDPVRRWRLVCSGSEIFGNAHCSADPLPELVAQLATETYSTDLLYYLLVNMHKLEFEARKDVVQIFNNLLRRQIGARFPTVEYLSNKKDILFAAFEGYNNEEIALNTSMILREMLRHETLAKILLQSEQYASRVMVSLCVLTH